MYNLKIQVAPNQERVFEVLVEKTKMIEEIQCVEHEKKRKQKDQLKREVGFAGPSSRPVKQTIEVRPPQNREVVGPKDGQTQVCQ